jgi:hypothetical protein
MASRWLILSRPGAQQQRCTTALPEVVIPVKRVAIVQSNYVPWRGYLDMISSFDPSSSSSTMPRHAPRLAATATASRQPSPLADDRRSGQRTLMVAEENWATSTNAHAAPGVREGRGSDRGPRPALAALRQRCPVYASPTSTAISCRRSAGFCGSISRSRCRWTTTRRGRRPSGCSTSV